MGTSMLINVLICALIIAGGAGIGCFEFITMTKLKQVYKSFDKVAIREHTKDADGEWMDSVGNVGMSTTVNVRYDRGELERNRGNFSTAYANYVTCGQLTSLLPLLGIFGTVAGLIMSSGSTDMGQMVAGLGTAMWTTLLGLIFSIVLKFFDAVWLGRLVNLIDAKFNEADTIITRQTLQAEVRRERTQIREAARPPQDVPLSKQAAVREEKQPPQDVPQPKQAAVREEKQQPQDVPQSKQAPVREVKPPQDAAEGAAEKNGREPTRITKVQKKTK